MKKAIVFLSALLALVACNKEITQPESTPKVFNITVNYGDGTKAAKTGWENGDEVYVFFSTVEAPKYLKLSYNGTWTATKYNGATEGDFDITSNGKMTAIYLPYGNSETVSADETSFVFGNSYTSYYLKAEKADYTVSGGVVSGTLNMVVPEGFVQFAMPHTSGTTKFFRETAVAYTLSEAHLTPCAFASVAADGTISNVTGYSAGDPITGYFYGVGTARTINFSGILDTPGVATDYAFSFVNNNGTVATYDDVTYTLSGNRTIAAKDAIKFPAIDNSAWKVPEPEYVRINGVNWAKWNIGASAVGGYGDYFAWGAIYPQDDYSNSDYREGGILTNLSPEKDVAYQKLGSEWHMPSQAEINSIIANGITWNWISDTSTYGTVGYEVYETFSPSNKIFLPAAGYRYFDPVYAGTDGDYWSAQYYNNNYAGLIYFDNGTSKWSTSLYRYFGAPVRPVKAGATPAEGHALSTSAIGEIVGSDGLAYAVTDKGNLPIGVMAVAMVAYKDGSNGLAIQLSSSPSTMGWYDAYSYVNSLPGGSWHLPSKAEWQNMFVGCAIAGDDVKKSEWMDPIAGFVEKIATAGATWPSSGGYWTSSSEYLGRHYCVIINRSSSNPNASFFEGSDAGPYFALGCLAF